MMTFLPHSRKVPGAAITRSGLVGILNFDLAAADEVLTKLRGFAAIFVPKFKIRVT